MEDRQYVYSSSPASDYTCEVFIYTPVGIRMIGLIKKSNFFLEISLFFFFSFTWPNWVGRFVEVNKLFMPCSY